MQWYGHLAELNSYIEFEKRLLRRSFLLTLFTRR